MQALRIYAGPKAMQRIAQNGLRPQDVGVVPGAAGGPKGLALGPLDRFILATGWRNQTMTCIWLARRLVPGAWPRLA